MKHAMPLTDFLSELSRAVENGTFVKLLLSHPTSNADDLKSVEIRPILVKRDLKLSFTYHHKTRDIVKNSTPTEGAALVGRMLGKSFTLARLLMQEADVHLSFQGQTATLTRHPATQTQAPSLTHDRPKNRTLTNTHQGYLQALGLTDAQGHVLKTAQDKFRQIDKYIEILDGLIRALPANTAETGPLRIADMGSGKGYLTFALYDHIANTLHRPVEVIGVETRPDMVALCNRIAQDNGMENLHFVQGSIADFDASGTHVVIALHACDTATDDALAKAVRANAALIVVAPCCQKQIRREMEAPHNTKLPPHALTFFLKYGTYVERMAEMLTDGLRAQILEICGYTTNVFAFVSDAHTPKNVMIVATLPTRPKKPEDIAALKAALATTKSQFGISIHYLETLLKL
jgi:SAM-dependent methyltransferase